MAALLTRARAPLLAIAPFVAGWLAVMIAVPLGRQEFPLNDDAAYSASLFSLLNGDGVHYFMWASALQIGQWIWATPFAWLIGQTAVATRISTLVLAGAGLIAWFVLLRREGGCDERKAMFGCWLLSLNPLFFSLSGTYMTDVPALSLSMLALALWSITIDGGRIAFAAAAGIAALLAVTTRQNAIVVPVVMAFMLWRKRPPAYRSLALVPLIVFAASLATIAWFLGRPDVYGFSPNMPTPEFTLRMTAAAVMYLGVLVAPGVVLVIDRRHAFRLIAALIVVAAIPAILVLYMRSLGRDPVDAATFPFVGNMLTQFGLFGIIPGDRPVLLGGGVRIALSAIGCAAFSWLVVRALDQARRWVVEPPLLLSLLHVPFIAISPFVFDRYFLALMPGAIALCLSGSPVPAARRFAVAAAVLVVAGGMSVALTHDWFASNAARWALGRAAVASGIPPAAIEGGFEWDHYFAIREGRWGGTSRPARGLVLPTNAAFFAGLEGRCALSLSPLDNAVVRNRAGFNSWLAGRGDFLLVCLPD